MNCGAAVYDAVSGMRDRLPGYWQQETSGVLRPVIERYLCGVALTDGDVAVMRAYLRQWIMWPLWRGPEVLELRRRVEGLTDRAAISAWLDDAVAIGIDPL